MRLRHVAVLAVLVGVWACGRNPNEPTELANGSMSAKINGSNWTANAAIAATFSQGLLSIAGTDTENRTIGFGTIVNAAPTTQSIPTAIGLNFILTIATNAQQVQAFQAVLTLPGSSGTLTVNTLSATGASGTFSFVSVAVPGTAATGTRNVTDGTFNVTF